MHSAATVSLFAEWVCCTDDKQRQNSVLWEFSCHGLCLDPAWGSRGDKTSFLAWISNRLFKDYFPQNLLVPVYKEQCTSNILHSMCLDAPDTHVQKLPKIWFCIKWALKELKRRTTYLNQRQCNKVGLSPRHSVGRAVACEPHSSIIMLKL